MDRHIAFFFITDMEETNAQAKAIVQEELPGLQMEEVECNPSMRDMYNCPFIRDEDRGEVFYGLSGIEFFAQTLRREKNGQHLPGRRVGVPA